VPLYDYRCTACGREVEVMHGVHDRGPEACAVCGGAMRKALSTPAIHFRGGGWAKKDAQAQSKARTAAADKGGTSGDAGRPAASGGEAGTSSGDKPSGEAAKAAPKAAKGAAG
jgi:putative FmdB family regulatory protein